MLKGFEEITYELDNYELSVLLPVIVPRLQARLGKKSIITNGKICSVLIKEGYDIKPERLRKIINYIRNNDLVLGLIAKGRGCYVATTSEEIEEYILSLQQRSFSIYTVLLSMVRQKELLIHRKIIK